ncbi:peptide N-glycanase [Pelomyxa schiedti]|nr:peptide N-glycanase [Pelomyxa schiedti]
MMLRGGLGALFFTVVISLLFDSVYADVNAALCGNGYLDDQEQCDMAVPFHCNVLTCMCDTGYVRSYLQNNCTLCGNGVVDAGEDCDWNNPDSPLYCTIQCKCDDRAKSKSGSCEKSKTVVPWWGWLIIAAGAVAVCGAIAFSGAEMGEIVGSSKSPTQNKPQEKPITDPAPKEGHDTIVKNDSMGSVRGKAEIKGKATLIQVPRTPIQAALIVALALALEPEPGPELEQELTLAVEPEAAVTRANTNPGSLYTNQERAEFRYTSLLDLSTILSTQAPTPTNTKNVQPQYDLEVDTDEVALLFKMQLYALTTVAPEDQKIIGLKGTVNDEDNLNSCGITPGKHLILLGPKSSISDATTSTSAPVATPETITPSSVPMTQQCTVPAMSTDWQSTCSRVFFPFEEIRQPIFLTQGRKICFGCKHACHQGSVTIDDNSGSPAVCQCGEIGTCLFLPLVTGIGAPLPVQRSILSEMSESLMRGARASVEIKNRVKNSLEQMKLYEQPALQQKARSLVPVDVLQELAKTTPNVSSPEDGFVVELLKWFKTQFFSWVDQPPCDRCGGKTTAAGMGQPSQAEMQGMAGRVELYRCSTCQVITRFPRYNHPGKLLETRKGRCGEWANAFCLILRSLGCNSRYVLDFTDHVWAEIYSDSLGRWVHCDCCESAFDKPLMYERGWQKKLTYVFAFAVDEVVDVTRRYTENFPEVLTRRTLAGEPWLQSFLLSTNTVLLTSVTSARKAVLDVTRASEIKDLEGTLGPRGGDTVGRISGSEEWKRSRNEHGGVPIDQTDPSNGLHKLPLFIFAPALFPSEFVPVACTSLVQSKVRLTGKQNSARGALWHQIDAIALTGGIETVFKFQILQPGADGFAFVIQAQGGNTIGEGGGGLAYHGIPKSVAVEFDTYCNQDTYDDPNDNHISLQTCFDRPNSASHRFSLACNPDILNLRDQAPHTVRVVLYQNLIVVWLDSQVVLRKEIDIRKVIGDSTTAWIGFTAATGGLSECHDILTFECSSLLP